MTTNKNENERGGATELVFLLDRSGSMSGLESDTIGGFNAMIERQRQEAGACLVSTVLFGTVCTVLHDRVPLARIPLMTGRDYRVGGCTALLDAIGGAIRHIGGIHKYARPEDVPAHTLFLITTDGLENASTRFTADEVRRMIARQEERCGWEFLFLAANIDAVQTARRYGIREENAVNYHADRRGTDLAYASMEAAVCSLRSSGKLGRDWRAFVDSDYESRKK